jgi:hypothetical protein
MSNCPRCLALTNDDFAYCAVCNRPRIVESLRAPMTPPNWLQPLQKALLGVLSLWLVITLGVAALREAKAVRDARQLLASGRPQDAWALLGPFLQDNPEHKQGLLVGGQAAIRLDLVADAKKCLGTLTGLSPELGKQLGNDYRQVLTGKARAISCDASSFSKLLETSQALGDSFPASVTAGLDGFVEACRKSRNDWTPVQVSSQLAQQGQEIDLIGKGYVPAMGRALGQGRYNDAKILAQYAVRVTPARAGEIKAVLDAERAKVAATKKTLGDLCQALQTNPRYHTGNTWCFPATAPPNVQTARDGWGRAFTYTAFAAAPGQTCRPGISLSSYGAAGQSTQERLSPAGGITCNLVSGVQAWQLPSKYWLGSSEGMEGGEGEGY